MFIDMSILLARYLLTDMDSARIHASEYDTPVQRATCETLPYHPAEHVEDVRSNEVMNNAQSSVASTVI